jgi:CelD/BcsL family acetyltransferase involved in cellulose biosynthesis
LEFDLVRPQDLSAARMARWGELQAQDLALDSPFLGPDWARVVERIKGEEAGVRVAVAREDGRDVGFFAAQLGAYTAIPAGGAMCDYQALVAQAGAAIPARGLVQALGVHRLDFTQMLAGQPTFAAYERGGCASYVIDLPQGYAAYEAERRAAGSSILKDSDKKRRKAEREVGPARFQAFSRAVGDFERLIDWKRAQFRATDQTDIFDAPWTSRLARELFESRDPAFGGVLFTLHLGDQLAAVHLHLRGKRTIHGWLIAHDPQFDRYSPGILLFQDILRWMDRSPYERLDLGHGDYRFKRELSTGVQQVTHGFVGVPSPASFVRSAAYQVRAVAEALPLGRVSELPGKAMRRMDQWRGLR